MRKEDNDMNDFKQLEELIAASVSPYHCILAAAGRLSAGGFKELPLAEPWELKQGGSYYINAFDSTLIAFTVGSSLTDVPELKLAASHTDWPCLKVKPSPEVTSLGYGKLNVEVYGGPLLNTWFDRPLSMAGKVSVTGDSLMKPRTIYIDFSRPVLT
ncbi:MAG: aspartyl aminopeptidase, partial [Lacrimispora sp.]|nr:aspartyl aminopeptidase [Lacrimispora sp.]